MSSSVQLALFDSLGMPQHQTDAICPFGEDQLLRLATGDVVGRIYNLADSKIVHT